MKLKWYYIILPMIALMVAVAGFFNYNITCEAVIKTSVFNISAQLSDLHQWQKWNKPLFGKNGIVSSSATASINGRHINLGVNNPASFTVEKRKGNQISTEQITITPLKTDTTALVQWAAKENGFMYCVNRLTGQNIEQQLKSLKKFAEDPDCIYGFPIRIVKVTDRVLCTTQKVVNKDSIITQIPLMLNNLKGFLSGSGIPVHKKYFYVSYLTVSNGVELAVALPVDQELPDRNGFQFLKFPADGRLLTGTYRGAYANLNQVYLSMDKYITDHHLTKVAQVLEAYPIGADFKSHLTARIIYPIH